ncbi:MAG: hypothetical protein AB8G99_20455, partial [Planctomycetaceae bacterium]
MARKKSSNRLTVRGIIKRGRVELLDDVKIEDGCLVDVTIVETREERQLKEAKKARQSAPKPLRFCFVGKKQFTSDPILFL